MIFNQTKHQQCQVSSVIIDWNLAAKTISLDLKVWDEAIVAMCDIEIDARDGILSKYLDTDHNNDDPDQAGSVSVRGIMTSPASWHCYDDLVSDMMIWIMPGQHWPRCCVKDLISDGLRVSGLDSVMGVMGWKSTKWLFVDWKWVISHLPGVPRLSPVSRITRGVAKTPR